MQILRPFFVCVCVLSVQAHLCAGTDMSAVVSARMRRPEVDVQFLVDLYMFVAAGSPIELRACSYG